MTLNLQPGEIVDIITALENERNYYEDRAKKLKKWASVCVAERKVEQINNILIHINNQL